jgi:hypothetical protein
LARSPWIGTAFYPILVHRPAISLHASSPHSVALMQLRFASLAVTSSRRDFHPLECAHAGRTKSWSTTRRVVAKAEYLDKGENPRFVVTSMPASEWVAQDLYETFYCARGEMENRIKEQMCLFADRLSTDEIKGNQLRLYFSAIAYTLMEALRRLALKGTEWAQAQVDTIRRKLLKIGAIVRVSARRVVLQLSSAYPWKNLYAHAFYALRC